MAEKKSIVDSLTAWAGFIAAIPPIGAVIVSTFDLLPNINRWLSQPHGGILIGFAILLWPMLIINAVLICKWIKGKRIHEIIGKWNLISQGDVIKTGLFFIIIRSDGVLVTSDGRPDKMTWYRHGVNEYFVNLCYPNNAIDRLILSDDGKTMRGYNSKIDPGPESVVYSYVG